MPKPYVELTLSMENPFAISLMSRKSNPAIEKKILLRKDENSIGIATMLSVLKVWQEASRKQSNSNWSMAKA